MASNKRAADAPVDDASSKAVKHDYHIYFQQWECPCGCPEIIRGQVGPASFASADEATVVAKEHVAVLLEERGYIDESKARAIGGLYTATVVDAEGEDGRTDFWVTKGEKIDWEGDDHIEEMKEDNFEYSLSFENIAALVRGGGAASAPVAAALSWQEKLQALDWGAVPGLVGLLPPMPPSGEVHFPSNDKVLKAFELTSLANVRCVVVAKWPYTNSKYATGLALSPGVPEHPFHKNVLFKALANDGALKFNGRVPREADLTAWATRAGVLLLNASLQDEKKHTAWKPFLKKVIEAVCCKADEENSPVGFLFLGAEAKKVNVVKGVSLPCAVECAYPALQYTKGFVESPPFSKVDEQLVQHGAARIQWEVLLD